VAEVVESEGEGVGSRFQIRERWGQSKGRGEGGRGGACSWWHVELPRDVAALAEDGDSGAVLHCVEESVYNREPAPARDHGCAVELRVQRAGNW
jgi:hypothetical protein